VVLLTIVLILHFSENHPPALQLVFLNYTNTPAGAEAVFSVRFPSRFGGCGWRDPVVTRKEGLGWKNWSATDPPSPKLRLFNGPIRRAAGDEEAMATAFAAFSVENTNDISRIIIQVDENPRRLSRMEWALWQACTWIRMDPGASRKSSYFITNETNIKPAE
jgi:hypothetical protein